jgi:hypothetical protein
LVEGGINVAEEEEEEEQNPDNSRVQSLSNYRLSGKTYSVSLRFADEAADSMSELMAKLNTDNPNDVMRRAFALLLMTQGKQILLMDPETGTTEAVEF